MNAKQNSDVDALAGLEAILLSHFVIRGFARKAAFASARCLSYTEVCLGMLFVLKKVLTGAFSFLGPKVIALLYFLCQLCL